MSENTQKNPAYKGKNAWKVYGDVTSAQRRFDLYKKCTRVYREAYKKHNSFDRLIVSCS